MEKLIVIADIAANIEYFNKLVIESVNDDVLALKFNVIIKNTMLMNDINKSEKLLNTAVKLGLNSAYE
jgi:hypothetical protein